MKKRIFALLLCCICIFSLFALPLSAATNEDVTNLLSYRLLLKILGPHAQITSPSNGVIRCYFPFYSPGYTFSVSFSVTDLCNYAGVTFEPNVFKTSLFGLLCQLPSNNIIV